MKTLLVLTDFSKNAKNAAEAAINLAEKFHFGKVLLVNNYINALFLPSADYIALPPDYYTAFKDESITQMKNECRRLQEIITNQKLPSGKVSIDSLNLAGTVADHLGTILKQNDITLILMGARRKIAGDFLFGSTINAVIQKANCPVLIVPQGQSVIHFKHIIFATDLELADIEAINYLIELYKNEHFHLSICHVTTPALLIPDFEEEDKYGQFMNALSKLKHKNISYHGLEGTNITKVLEKFEQETMADLFVITHRKHSFVWRIFHQSPSRSLIKYQNISLMTLPEHFGEQNTKSAMKSKNRNSNPSLYIL